MEQAWPTGACLALALTLVGSAAGAQPGPTVELEWTAPEGCPDRAFVLLELERQLGKRPVGITAKLRGVVSPGKALAYLLELELTLGERPSERILTSDVCEELGNAAALIAALAISEASEPAPPRPPASRVLQLIARPLFPRRPGNARPPLARLRARPRPPTR
jgi:hypothetical protein